MPPRRKKPSKSRKAPRARRWWRIVAVAAFVVLVAGAWMIWPFWQLTGQFGSEPTRRPSRLYGQPTRFVAGTPLTLDTLSATLEGQGYRPSTGPDDDRTGPGTYVRDGAIVDIHRRPFPTAQGWNAADHLRLRLEGRTIAAVSVDGRSVSSASLDPPLIASYYDRDLQERRPVSIDALPEDLIYAVLAAEDAGFLDHPGISITGALRAAWVNLRAQGVRQGGSTLTQQLVKNRYLTHERTWWRKIREAILALMIDYRYGKRAILEAYLNEIYWGRSGSVDLIGVGAAAWAYFDTNAEQLTLAESATLAGMIRSPGSYSPRAHPERAEAQRNEILARLGRLRWVSAERLARAATQPMRARASSVVARQAPFFTEAVAAEAEARFGIRGLRDSGYTLLSTLDLTDQAAAEDAVAWGLGALEDGWEKDRETSAPLEAALISVDPRDGAIRAYVGGRDYGRSQFDRVSQARRQAGSAFKPIVYAAAYAAGLSPASRYDDAPFRHVQSGKVWQPRNSDGRHRGWVTTRVALEQSLNVPTAKLGLQVGLNTVVDLAHDMGIETALEPFPALALGAMAVSPRELATVYATLAAGGARPWLHGLVAVLDPSGKPVVGQPVPSSTPALRADVAFLVTNVLQGVLDVGTAAGVRAQGISDPLAGKTGTTNSRRDSWFAGYAPDRASLVWVGYDNNATTRLSGARAALPIWARFTHRVRPAGGYPTFETPAGIVRVLIDPDTGALARGGCPRAGFELFLVDHLPREACPFHAGRPLPQGEGVEVEPERKGNRFKRWLKRVRGRGERPRRPV